LRFVFLSPGLVSNLLHFLFFGCLGFYSFFPDLIPVRTKVSLGRLLLLHFPAPASLFKKLQGAPCSQGLLAIIFPFSPRRSSPRLPPALKHRNNERQDPLAFEDSLSYPHSPSVYGVVSRTQAYSAGLLLHAVPIGIPRSPSFCPSFLPPSPLSSHLSP